MSGCELDWDGTDSYHPEHPWEQSGHALYISPRHRSKDNWPPEQAYPAGPAEEQVWLNLPEETPRPPVRRVFLGRQVGRRDA